MVTGVNEKESNELNNQVRMQNIVHACLQLELKVSVHSNVAEITITTSFQHF